MGHWRCHNQYCADGVKGFDFEAPTGECPQCGSPDSLKILTCHFVVADRDWLKARKLFRPVVACGVQWGAGPDFHASGEPYLTNCPECMKSDAYKELYRPAPKVFLKALPEGDQDAAACCG